LAPVFVFPGTYPDSALQEKSELIGFVVSSSTLVFMFSTSVSFGANFGSLEISTPKRQMNKNNYRLVFSRLRHMLVAVEETATATAKASGQAALFTLRPIAFAALVLLGALPSWSGAQIVPGGE
jgi:hypothetical protein